MKPTIGRIVIYRSKTGAYDIPAMIVATEETLDPKGVELGHVPPLSAGCVHLVVYTPGKQGTAREGNEVNPTIGGGSYQEWDIPYFSTAPHNTEHGPEAAGDPTPGSWRWPERV